MKTITYKGAQEAHTEALEQLAAMRTALQQAEADHAQLHAISPAELLANPGKAAEVADARARAAHLLSVRRDMVQAAERVAYEAACTLVGAEAGELNPKITAAEKALEEWRAKESELLGALEAHTGQRYTRPVVNVIEMRQTGRSTFQASKEVTLKAAVDALRQAQTALEVASTGDDPVTVCPLENLPASLRYDGVLPSEAAVERHERDALRAAEEAEVAADMAHAGELLAAAAKALGLDEVPEACYPGQRLSKQGMIQWRHGARARVNRLDEDAQSIALKNLEVIAWYSDPSLADDIAKRLRPSVPKEA